MPESKQTLREEIWRALEESGDDRFPGAEGRIPNFVGRDEAAGKLAELNIYRTAETIKVNPDSPQTPVRKRALEDGKCLYMAVPKLKKRKCFLELDPKTMEGTPSDWSSIKGASKHGVPVHPTEMDPVDLIVTGAVGVDSDGRRLGKGGGYSDLEFAILLEVGLIERAVPIATTVHPVQVLEAGRIPREQQDLSLSAFSTPEETVRIDDPETRPVGLEENLLDDERIEAIPILDELL